MADINKVWLSGIAVSQPILTQIGQKTPFTTFTLQVNERFIDKNGETKSKPNLITIESLGKSAESTAKKVKQGQRFTIDGYIRQDVLNGAGHIRVRTFAVYADESSDQINHKEGLRQALELLKKSRDLSSAIERLEELIG